VFVDLVVAVNVGVILAALLFMRRMADAVQVEQQDATVHPSTENSAAPAGNGYVIYSIEGPFFFGAAAKLERTLQHIQRPATTLILRMGNVPFVDATGIFALEEIITDFQKHGANVVLAEVRPNVRQKLVRSGVLEHVGLSNVVGSLEHALQRARELQAGTTPSNQAA
jgi:SulP family sulfate permease